VGIDAVLNFVSPLLDKASEEILALRKTEDPKSLFQEWAQSEGLSAPQYITRNSMGPDHSKMFEVDATVSGNVYGSGQGHSKQAAAKEAARDALRKLGISHV
jgi:ribonuclease-3